jgi:hypothetical protein
LPGFDTHPYHGAGRRSAHFLFCLLVYLIRHSLSSRRRHCTQPFFNCFDWQFFNT